MDQAELYQGILRGVSSPSVMNNVVKSEYDLSMDNKENHYSVKDSIVFEDDEDVPDFKNHRSIRDLIVFKEDPEDVSKNNNDVTPKRMLKDVTGTINLLDIKKETDTKIKAEPSNIEANLVYHQSFRDSIVFKNDFKSGLYNNHTFKGEMVNKDDPPSDSYNNQTFKDRMVNNDDEMVNREAMVNNIDHTLDLYNNHTFKEEMVIGPEVIQHSVYQRDEISEENNDLDNTNNKRNKKKRVKQHSCKCGKKYSSKMWFSRHSCDMVFICDFCNKQFDAKDKIRRHIKSHRKCDKPQQIKTIKSLTYDFDHACNLCPKKFGLKVSLNKHIKIVHENKNPDTVKDEHLCDICSKVFTLKSNLRRHIKIHLGTAKTFECETCAITYKSNDSLRNHIISKHDGVLKIKGQLQNKILTKPSIKCTYCGKTLIDRSGCNRHEKYCCQGNPHMMTCDICKKTYHHRQSLIGHMMVHMGLTPKSYERPAVQCDLCKKMFSRKTSLKRHMESVHLKFRKYICKFCDRGISKPWLLTMHENKCQGMKKSFMCDICPKKYRSKFRLNWHKASNHYDIVKSTMICCELCPKVYKNKNGLKLHMEVKHMNLKPYSCNKCKTKFTRKWLLQSHEKRCLSDN